IYNDPVSPAIRSEFCWFYPYPISIDILKKQAQKLIGTYDFSAFTTEPKEDNIRTISKITIEEEKPYIKIQITGTNFLYKMVRILVGTLADIASNRLATTDIKEILLSKNRKKAGQTAPGSGLFLTHIQFKDPYDFKK
ncbi:MAG TPA: hypothetical protein P5048_04490, partial [Chlamydiales bacterium]|nr:hypothetical protein [Chlamydiales bacterium]